MSNSLSYLLHDAKFKGNTLKAVVEDPDLSWLAHLYKEHFEDLALLVVGTILLATFRFYFVRVAQKRLETGIEVAILDLSQLNDAFIVKEVFLTYLGAAILEPILAIAGLEEATGKALFVNIAMLLSIVWWISLVTDAFDYVDIGAQRQYKLWYEEAKDNAAAMSTPEALPPSPQECITEVDVEPSDPLTFLHPRCEEEVRAEQTTAAAGRWQGDLALWYVLCCVAAAYAGIVDHRDVVHAYIIVILWAITHYHCRGAVCWIFPRHATSLEYIHLMIPATKRLPHWAKTAIRTLVPRKVAEFWSYVATFLIPSATLEPLQWSMVLRDVFDGVSSLEDVQGWIAFIRRRCGVSVKVVV